MQWTIISERKWTFGKSEYISTSSVMNLANGSLVREALASASGEVAISLQHLPGLTYADGKFRSLTMHEMLGEDAGGMFGKLDGIMSNLGKFAK